jgi:DDE superfamily endonuclease
MAWLVKNGRIHFHYTPTSGSWLNQVEGFFGILAKQSLRATDFPSKKQLRDHIAAYIKHWNAEPMRFIWTKPATAIIQSYKRMIARIS